LLAVEKEPNNRHHHLLSDHSPAERFEALLASPVHSMLRRWRRRSFMLECRGTAFGTGNYLAPTVESTFST
jgi:hypothetical protein